MIARRDNVKLEEDFDDIEGTYNQAYFKRKAAASLAKAKRFMRNARFDAFVDANLKLE